MSGLEGSETRQFLLQYDSVDDAFAQGGNRLCFLDPEDVSRCVKVARPDRSPQSKRRHSNALGRLKPLSSFDDNQEEYRVYQHIQRLVGDAAYQLIPRCYGFVETNFGKGLVTELIRDQDGLISMSLKQYLWQRGLSEDLQRALHRFSRQWVAAAVPSRNLLLHNIVVQQGESGIQRLVVIDGLGWPDFIPFAYYLPFLAKLKARRKVNRLPTAIDELLHKQQHGEAWGYHGWLDRAQREKGLQ